VFCVRVPPFVAVIASATAAIVNMFLCVMSAKMCCYEILNFSFFSFVY